MFDSRSASSCSRGNINAHGRRDREIDREYGGGATDAAIAKVSAAILRSKERGGEGGGDGVMDVMRRVRHLCYLCYIIIRGSRGWRPWAFGDLHQMFARSKWERVRILLLHLSVAAQTL